MLSKPLESYFTAVIALGITWAVAHDVLSMIDEIFSLSMTTLVWTMIDNLSAVNVNGTRGDRQMHLLSKLDC